MKRITLTLLAVILILTACKKNVEPPSSQAPSASSEMTQIEIKAHNKKIEDSQINLVSLMPIKSGDKIAVIETELGKIYFVLYPEQAPKTVEAFEAMVGEKVFENTELSSNILNFFSEISPKSIPSSPLPSGVEFSVDLWNFSGAIGLRRDQETGESDGTVYFITNDFIGKENEMKLGDIGYPQKVIDTYTKQGGIPSYDTKFTVFGQAYKGLEVMRLISRLPSDEDGTPKEAFKIIGITITDYDPEDKEMADERFAIEEEIISEPDTIVG